MKKVFATLGVIVIAIIVIAAAVNIFLPNVTAYLAGTVEEAVYKATGFEWDIDGNGQTGLPTAAPKDATGDAIENGAGVQGFN